MDRLFKYARPKGLEDYILDHANFGYILRMDGGTYCTRKRCWCDECCEQPDLKHGDPCECICCPEDGEFYCNTYLHGGRGRKKREETGRILWMRREGKNTVLQLDYYEIDYEDLEPKVYLLVDAQYRLSKDKRQYRRKQYYEWMEDAWKEVKSIRLPKPPSGISWYPTRYEKLLFYEPSKDSFGTDLRYADLTPFLDGKEEQIIDYLMIFLKRKSTELMMKAGYERLVFDYLSGSRTPAINWRGKNLKSIFRLNREELRQIRGFDMNKLDRLHYAKSLGLNIMPEHVDALPRFRSMTEEFLKQTEEQGLDRMQIIKYCTKQKTTVTDYMDYIRDCRTLMRDMTDRHVLRPKNFAEEHQKMAMRVQTKLDSEQEEMFTLQTQRITEMLHPYEDGELMIRPAEGQEELQKESEELKHCVRNYGKRVAKGTCAILFIRKKEDPDKPFYTLELNEKHEVVQCRGLQNRSTTPEIDIFIKNWKEEQYGKHDSRS